MDKGRGTLDKGIFVHAEVAAALIDCKPVVALESTVISHGLPRPHNLETARGMEAAIRAGGAVITDNATTHRKELAEFAKYVRSLPDAASAEVAIGNGIEWTVKVK